MLGVLEFVFSAQAHWSNLPTSPVRHGVIAGCRAMNYEAALGGD